ncbi:MAG: hypothetical protein A3I07_00410 [Candidatus Doudnabacteria bacterium RIFCSPLOWO2_02_FULL_42_9]|nr:MAG: hypothetical protein A3I07_00410 [Candidatus Doudnabacteria bacterium RIFCSPLOWO2_02_FULL_42_9]
MALRHDWGLRALRGYKLAQPFYEAHPEILISVGALATVYYKYFRDAAIQRGDFETMLDRIRNNPEPNQELETLNQRNAQARTKAKRKR